MIFKFKTMLLATALGALAFASCREQDSVTGDDGNVKYVIEIEGAGQTKGSVASVNLGLADLDADLETSQEVTATLYRYDGTNRKPVTSGVTFSWSSTSSAFTHSEGIENNKRDISSSSEGDGSLHVSASLDGDEVASANVTVSVQNNRALKWRPESASTLTAGEVKSDTLESNFTTTVAQVSSDNSNFKIGSSESSVSSDKLSLSFGEGNETRVVYYKYEGTSAETVELSAKAGDISAPERSILTVVKTVKSIAASYSTYNSLSYIYPWNGHNFGKLTVTATYNDNSNEDVTSHYDDGSLTLTDSKNVIVTPVKVSGDSYISLYASDDTWGGTTSLTVSYGGKSTTVSNIKYAPLLTQLTVTIGETNQIINTMGYNESSTGKWKTTWQNGYTDTEAYGGKWVPYVNMGCNTLDRDLTVVLTNAGGDTKTVWMGWTSSTGWSSSLPTADKVGCMTINYESDGTTIKNARYEFTNYYDYDMGFAYTYGSK